MTMKTDRVIQEDVLKALEWEPSVDATRIGVTVRDGVVTLQGIVRSFFEKTTADRVTRHVIGVRAVANDVIVNFDGLAPRSDSSIALAIANVLSWNSAIPPEAIKATVSDGWVTLNGKVDWQYQRTAAERSIEHLLGVRGITNAVLVKPHVNAIDVTAKIESAFKRSAEVDASRVKVEARNGEITLTGTVRSLSERREAERAAWSAPGVTLVDDRLAVSP
jgi:osmotically-inducible protein OsmY